MNNVSNITSTQDVNAPTTQRFPEPEEDEDAADFTEVPIDEDSLDAEVSMEDIRRQWFAVDEDEDDDIRSELGGSD
jgi:hypothetical protein